ncbi:hypothetical protein [Actinophytocola sp.]|uniref:hypothetical protein n=1 Tax=Actinophytocola sp. TaxID=1872138 RepID=UPI003D6AEFAC
MDNRRGNAHRVRASRRHDPADAVETALGGIDPVPLFKAEVDALAAGWPADS